MNRSVEISEEDLSPGLAPGRVGAASIGLLGLAAAAPVVTLVTVVPAVLADGAGPLVPWSFAGVGLLLLLFCAGQAATARRSPSAGAAYSQVTRGLGRPSGLVAAWLAIAGYHAIQFGLYTLAGLVAAPLLSSFAGLTAPWWAVAAACWAIVAICGTMRIEVAAGLIGLFAVAQAAVLAGLGAANVLQPFGGRITGDSILITDRAVLDRPALGLLLTVAVLTFAGFESTAAYAEEGFQPRRSAGFGGYGAVLLIALLLGGVSWTMIVAAGPDRAATIAGARGPELIFDLAAERLAPWAVTLGRFVLLAGVVAAILAVHHAIARYLFALGRERVLPAVLGSARRRTAAPRAASMTQSLIAGAALAGAYAAGAGPGPRTARWLIVGGALSILVVLLLAALAALLHLNRVPGPEGVWGRFLAPVPSTVSLASVAFLAVRDLPALLDMPSGYPLVRAIPAALLACVLLAVAHALLLRRFRPVRYAGIGLAGTPVVITPMAAPSPPTSPATPASPPSPASHVSHAEPLKIPRQRDPGAHRPERVDPRQPAIRRRSI
ncbi:APC family permease [Actinoplanes sp. NEAU-A12]|uniref:APC family permease n=1 Tax=Actinoplanes sandaracinus TaxID=3045177 RepID=A0ABT6WL67_9ACTN|nr:APC family permease [Actinoplanes sandaracinus]MDI6100476.1 APC family permease [Actinoplanes sandaracinus]